MPYSISISTLFHIPVERVYQALTFLDEYPLWNSGVIRVSKSGYLVENMLIGMESIVGGKPVISNLEIARLVPHQSIEMINNSGIISYRLMYELLSHSANETELICMLQFTFKNFAMDIARPAIEAMAENRIRGNLESLRILLQA